jgi:hypothetical protein
MALSFINTCNGLFNKGGQIGKFKLISRVETLKFEYNLINETITSIVSPQISPVVYTDDTVNNILTIDNLTPNVQYVFSVTTDNNNNYNITGIPLPLYETTINENVFSNYTTFSSGLSTGSSNLYKVFAISSDNKLLIIGTATQLYYSRFISQWSTPTIFTTLSSLIKEIKFTEDDNRFIVVTSGATTGLVYFCNMYYKSADTTIQFKLNEIETIKRNYLGFCVSNNGNKLITYVDNSSNIYYGNWSGDIYGNYMGDYNAVGGGVYGGTYQGASGGNLSSYQLFTNGKTVKTMNISTDGTKIYYVDNEENNIYFADWSNNTATNVNVISKINGMIPRKLALTPNKLLYLWDNNNKFYYATWNGSTYNSFLEIPSSVYLPINYSYFTTNLYGNDMYAIGPVSVGSLNNNIYKISTTNNYNKLRSTDYKFVKFNTNNTIRFNVDKTVQILIVGGGGGGGGSYYQSNNGAGGGGGGSVGIGNFTFLKGIDYNITIGSGGTGGIGNQTPATAISATNGGNTKLSSGSSDILIAYGGGRGETVNKDSANNGGSGGGGDATGGTSTLSIKFSYNGFTFYGNNGSIGTSVGGSGGGGAGSAGQNNRTAGSGITWTVDGSTYGIGGGGGGAAVIPGTTSMTPYAPDNSVYTSGYGGRGDYNSFRSTNGGDGYPQNSGNAGGGGGAGGIFVGYRDTNPQSGWLSQGYTIGGKGSDGVFTFAYN